MFENIFLIIITAVLTGNLILACSDYQNKKREVEELKIRLKIYEENN